MLYDLMLSYKEAVPYILVSILAIFTGIHWLLERKTDKSIPYTCPKSITYAQIGFVILAIIIGLFFLETNPVRTSFIVISSSFIITGLASFIEGLYVRVNIPESKRHPPLYFDGAFSLLFGFVLLWLLRNWLE